MKKLYILFVLLTFTSVCYGFDEKCHSLSDYKRCPSGLVCKPDLLNKSQFCIDVKKDRDLKDLIEKGETCEEAFDRLYGSLVRENELGLCKGIPMK